MRLRRQSCSFQISLWPQFDSWIITRNLQSVTTTSADRFLVTVLCILGECDDPDELARAMFRAKTEWIVGAGWEGLWMKLRVSEETEARTTYTYYINPYWRRMQGGPCLSLNGHITSPPCWMLQKIRLRHWPFPTTIEWFWQDLEPMRWQGETRKTSQLMDGRWELLSLRSQTPSLSWRWLTMLDLLTGWPTVWVDLCNRWLERKSSACSCASIERLH